MTKGDRRYDAKGPVVLMAYADNWLLVRRPRCVPFALYVTGWWNLSAKPITKSGAGITDDK